MVFGIRQLCRPRPRYGGAAGQIRQGFSPAWSGDEGRRDGNSLKRDTSLCHMIVIQCQAFSIRGKHIRQRQGSGTIDSRVVSQRRWSRSDLAWQGAMRSEGHLRAQHRGSSETAGWVGLSRRPCTRTIQDCGSLTISLSKSGRTRHVGLSESDYRGKGESVEAPEDRAEGGGGAGRVRTAASQFCRTTEADKDEVGRKETE